MTIIFPPFIPPGFFRQPFFENNNNACGWEAGTVCRGHLHLLNMSSQCVQKIIINGRIARFKKRSIDWSLLVCEMVSH